MVLPSITTWDVPGTFDKAKLIYEIASTPGYAENMWPTIKLVVGKSVGNVSWTAAILTTFAVFDALKIIPYLIENK